LAWPRGPPQLLAGSFAKYSRLIRDFAYFSKAATLYLL
jgi:hypothetical protein